MCSFRNINCSNYKITYPNFKSIFLNGNNITDFHEDVFTSLPNIDTIFLHTNRITSISYYLFINNNKLEYLSLKNNKIKIFIVELTHIFNLRLLNLDENPIETFHEGTLKNFFIRNINITKYLAVGFINNVTCDCNVNWIRRIKEDIKIHSFEFEGKHLNLTEFLKLYEHLENNCILNNTNIDTNLTG